MVAMLASSVLGHHHASAHRAGEALDAGLMAVIGPTAPRRTIGLRRRVRMRRAPIPHRIPFASHQSPIALPCQTAEPHRSSTGLHGFAVDLLHLSNELGKVFLPLPLVAQEPFLVIGKARFDLKLQIAFPPLGRKLAFAYGLRYRTARLALVAAIAESALAEIGLDVGKSLA